MATKPHTRPGVEHGTPGAFPGTKQLPSPQSFSRFPDDPGAAVPCRPPLRSRQEIKSSIFKTRSERWTQPRVPQPKTPRIIFSQAEAGSRNHLGRRPDPRSSGSPGGHIGLLFPPLHRPGRGNSLLHRTPARIHAPAPVHSEPPGLGATASGPGLPRGDLSCPLSPRKAGQVPGSREGKGWDSGSDTERREALRGNSRGPVAAAQGGAEPARTPRSPDAASEGRVGQAARAPAKAPPRRAPRAPAKKRGKVLRRGRAPMTPRRPQPQPGIPSAPPLPAARPVPEAETDPRGTAPPSSSAAAGRGDSRGGAGPAGGGAGQAALGSARPRPPPTAPAGRRAAGPGSGAPAPGVRGDAWTVEEWAAGRGPASGTPEDSASAPPSSS
nr:uncharacterized protein LOC116154739 [Camelus dromedarius]